MPSNGFNKSKKLHEIIEVKAFAHVCKLTFSTLTNIMIFEVNENLCNSFYNLRTIVAPLVSLV